MYQSIQQSLCVYPLFLQRKHSRIIRRVFCCGALRHYPLHNYFTLEFGSLLSFYFIFISVSILFWIVRITNTTPTSSSIVVTSFPRVVNPFFPLTRAVVQPETRKKLPISFLNLHFLFNIFILFCERNKQVLGFLFWGHFVHGLWGCHFLSNGHSL